MLVFLAMTPLLSVAQTVDDEAAFQTKYTDASKIGLTLSNFGFFGNDFINRSPSFEYPLGSGIEHMVRGGLWVGGINGDTGDTLVTTGSQDGTVGTGGDRSTEWSPLDLIEVRSFIKTSQFFHPDAVSELDFITRYFDLPVDGRGFPEQHRPLEVVVRQRSFVWSFEPADGIVIVEFTIKNIGESDILNLYAGVYSELASGNKDARDDWPPGGEWFDNKILAYNDSLRLFTERRFAYEGGLSPTSAGYMLLGTKPIPLEDMKLSMNWWPWDPGDLSKDQDGEKYAILSNGEIDDVNLANMNLAADPAECMSVGPFPRLAVGDSVIVAYAFIGVENPADVPNDDIVKARWAQDAFDNDYVVPQPPRSPALLIEPRSRGLAIRWNNGPELEPDPATGVFDFEGYRIWVSRNGVKWNLFRELDVPGDSLGFNTGFDDVAEVVTIGGQTYHYRTDITGLKDGFKYWVAISSFDTGDPQTPSLDSGTSQNKVLVVPGNPAVAGVGKPPVKVFPNPYKGSARWDGRLDRERFLWFTNLPPRAVIRIFNVAGDLIDEIEFDTATYSGQNAPGIGASEFDEPQLSGGMAAWDLLSRNGQPVASGLYVFSVENLDTGENEVGKFLILR